MLGVHAEHDAARARIGPEDDREVTGREPGPAQQGDHPLEVARAVDPFGDLAAEPVELAGFGLPALGIR